MELTTGDQVEVCTGRDEFVAAVVVHVWGSGEVTVAEAATGRPRILTREDVDAGCVRAVQVAAPTGPDRHFAKWTDRCACGRPILRVILAAMPSTGLGESDTGWLHVVEGATVAGCAEAAGMVLGPNGTPVDPSAGSVAGMVHHG